MGAVRTTFAMVAASLVRRKQMLANGATDPYALKSPNGMVSSSPGTPVIGTVGIGDLSYWLSEPTNHIAAQQPS